MSYAVESCALAGGLSRLLAHGSTELDSIGYAQALIARSATLTLAADVHREVAGIRRHAVGRTVTDLENHPVAVLGRVLSEQPRPRPQLAPTDALNATSLTTAGRQWGAAARHAILAHHEWLTGLRRAWAPVQAWTALADVAALAEAVTVLDRDLTIAATSLGRGEDAAELASAAASGLRLTAAQVQTLARAGPLAAWPIDRIPLERGRVHQVTSTADLPQAQANLVSLLSQTRSLRPEHANQIAIGQARNATTIARTLHELTDRDNGRHIQALADSLDAIARPLLAAGDRPQRTASLHPADPRPLHQAGELTRHLTRHGSARPTPGDSTPDDISALVSYAGHIRSVVRALTDAAGREVLTGRWLVPSQGAATAWTPVALGLPEPGLLTALRNAIPLTDDVSATANRISGRSNSSTKVPLGTPPREALTVALSQAQRVRPTAPGHRPAWIPGRRPQAR